MPDSLQNILEQNLANLQADMQQTYMQQNANAPADFAHTTTPNTGTLLGPDINATTHNFEQMLQEWITARGITIHSQEQLLQQAKFLKWWIQKNGNKQFRSATTTNPYATPISNFTKRLTTEVTDYYTTQIQTLLTLR